MRYDFSSWAERDRLLTELRGPAMMSSNMLLDIAIDAVECIEGLYKGVDSRTEEYERDLALMESELRDRETQLDELQSNIGDLEAKLEAIKEIITS